MKIIVTVSEGIFPEGPNPCDERAVEAAVRLKEQHHGHITLITIGNIQDSTLGAYLGLGVDEGIRVMDHGIDQLEPLQVGWLLGQIIRPLSPDLIFCGEKAEGSSATGFVPYVLAEFLNLPIVPGAIEIEVKEKQVIVQRLIERGDRQILTAPCPAVVSVSRSFATPRYSAFAKARRVKIHEYQLADLKLDHKELEKMASDVKETGRQKAKPRPKKLYIPSSAMSASERMAALMAGGSKGRAKKSEGNPYVETSPHEAAARILKFLKEEKILEY